MAAELGGMPVSAPGAMSSRTDKQPVMDVPSAFYGDAKDMREIQSAAPMAASPAPPKPGDLFAPTARPDEPVTAGVDYGQGPGSQALGLDVPQYKKGTTLTETLEKLMQVQGNQDRLSTLLRIASRNGW